MLAAAEPARLKLPGNCTAGKCAWALIVLLIPIIGVIAYYIARPPDAFDVHTSEDAGTAEVSMRTRHPA